MQRSMLNIAAITLILALLLGVGVVSGQEVGGDEKQSDSAKEAYRSETKAKLKTIFENIVERNGTIKRSPEWLKEAYSSLKIKKLKDIPKGDYAKYKKYLTNGDIYIIVHPGYYAFFHDKGKKYTLNTGDKGYPYKNLVERYAENISSDDIVMQIMMEQERIMRQFLEFMSMQKKLVVLIMPPDYKEHMTYGYEPGGLDEFARYVNDLTNMSESIIYTESEGHENGLMKKDDLETLDAFIKEIGAKNIMLGGGYLGKCLGNFYDTIITKYTDVYFVLDITFMSPIDMVTDKVKVLTKDGKININAMKKFFTANGDDIAKLKRLTVYNSVN